MKPQTLNIILYMAKCCTACVIAFLASPYLSADNSTWFFISIVLVLTPDSKEAMNLATMRIKANLLASVVSLIIMLAGLPSIFGICVAFCIIIALCERLKLIPAVRTALAAVIIVMLHPANSPAWELAKERALYVVGGCVVGLILTFLFHRSLSIKSLGLKKATKPDHGE